MKRSEEKESGLSLDLGVEELIGTARRECENLVAVKDIFFFFATRDVYFFFKNVVMKGKWNTK